MPGPPRTRVVKKPPPPVAVKILSPLRPAPMGPLRALIPAAGPSRGGARSVALSLSRDSRSRSERTRVCSTRSRGSALCCPRSITAGSRSQSFWRSSSTITSSAAAWRPGSEEKRNGSAGRRSGYRRRTGVSLRRPGIYRGSKGSLPVQRAGPGGHQTVYPPEGPGRGLCPRRGEMRLCLGGRKEMRFDLGPSDRPRRALCQGRGQLAVEPAAPLRQAQQARGREGLRQGSYGTMCQQGPRRKHPRRIHHGKRRVVRI
jgi:hypothetical protein